MLKNIIEALIFAAGKGLFFEEIKSVFDNKYSDEEIKNALSEIKAEYSGKKGIILIEYNNKYEFQTNVDYGDILADVLSPIKEKELSKTLLESLAIVAYKQPVTRLDIEEIRGVSSDYAVTTLLKLNLITIKGRRNTLGKPIVYGTTDEFLKRFQLNSLQDLPDYEELLYEIRNNFEKYYKSSGSLYREHNIDEDSDDSEKIFNEVAASDAVDLENGEELPEFLKGEDIIKID